MAKALSSAQARTLAAIWSHQNVARVSFRLGDKLATDRTKQSLIDYGYIEPNGAAGPMPNTDYEWREHWLTKAGLAALADYFGRLAKR